MLFPIIYALYANGSTTIICFTFAISNNKCMFKSNFQEVKIMTPEQIENEHRSKISLIN